MEFLTSSLLLRVSGLRHGFGLRAAGSREAAREAAREGLRGAGDVYFLKQVHGCTVASPPWSEPPAADACVTHRPGELLAIETADCLPVLIVDRIQRRAAAVHAGWRGTAAGVVRAAVRTLVEEGSNPGELVAALGPAIGPCCYEVGREVEDCFPQGARFFVPGKGERKHLDVIGANRAQLEESGLDSKKIEALNLCTKCREDLFFSYRRDGANAGRMISVVGFEK